MALILCIDTATENAFVSLHDGEQSLAVIENNSQKEHASFLHPAIHTMLDRHQFSPGHLEAVAISHGPGSYTGLRVAMATAKGLCYALNIPLICINSLEALTAAAITSTGYQKKNRLYCPMIDARRMEVFTALYDESLKPVRSPQSLVLDANSFSEDFSDNEIIFFGTGAAKWEAINTHKAAKFIEITHIPAAFQTLSNIQFKAKNFTDLVISEPFYLKSFYDGN